MLLKCKRRQNVIIKKFLIYLLYSNVLKKLLIYLYFIEFKKLFMVIGKKKGLMIWWSIINKLGLTKDLVIKVMLGINYLYLI